MQQIGKYQLVRKLATGGMAEVFLAKAAGPMGFEKTLVLKRILPHLAEEATFVEMFLSEAKLAAQLTHPNIVQIFDFGEADGAYFLAMEYIDGPNLRTLGKRAAAQGMALPPTLCARLIASACEGLAFAHDFADPDTGEALGLIHRDISPDNILLSKQGAVKVVDFGIAKAAGQSHRTQSGIIKGKLAYMPPEQVRAKPLDRRVDVYALGVVLYELLTGHKPFESPTDVGLMQAILFEPLVPASQHRPELPEALQQILDKALAKDREQRYADCPAFQSDLEDFILSAGRPVTTQQLAQLIAQVSTGGDLPMPTPHGTPRSGPKQATPVHTPAPHTGPGIHGDSGSMHAPRAEPVQPPEDTVPTEASEPRTAPYIPSVKKAAQDEPILAGTREQPAPVPPRRTNPLVPALVGGALLLAGGGFMLWRSAATPPPAPVVVAAVAPAPPSPSTPPAAEPAVAAPTETPPAAPEPQAEATPSPAPTEPASPPPANPTPEPTPAPVVATAPAKPAVKRPPAPPKPVGKGTLEFRIRPYATVFVNGKKEGDTPMPPLELPAGRYALKLVNTDLSKTVTRTVEVKAGQPTVLKVNLLEE